MVYGVYTMKRKQIYIEDAQERAIKRLAARRGVSEAMVIREAMAKYIVDGEPESEDYLTDEEDPLLGIIGLVDDPDAPIDGSINHDHYIYGVPRKYPIPTRTE
jgi:hypothetical protein